MKKPSTIKSIPEKTPSEVFRAELQTFLEGLEPDLRNWDALFRELQALVFRVLDEKKRAQRIRFFERGVKETLKHLNVSLATAEEVNLLLALGHRYEKLGAWDQALEVYQQVVDLAQSAELAGQRAEALRWSGHIAAMKNEWQTAEARFQESLAVCRAQGDARGEAQGYNSLGILNFERGEFEQARQHWQSALELADDLEDAAVLTAQLYNNLGALANILGQPQQALTHYAASIARFEKAGHLRGLAETHHNLGMTYFDLERWPEADLEYHQSYQLARKIGDVRLQATVRLNRVKIFLTIEDWWMAEGLCRQALKIFKQLGDRLGEAEVYKFLGLIHAKTAKWAEAQSQFLQGIELTQTLNSPLNEAEIHLEFGRVLREKGYLDIAREQYETALGLFEKVNADILVEQVKQEMTRLSP